jgi:hypothetical protein
MAYAGGAGGGMQNGDLSNPGVSMAQLKVEKDMAQQQQSQIYTPVTGVGVGSQAVEQQTVSKSPRT